ncbi:methionine--tRNA ligase [Candidatus Wolfebacteria bacterium]|nr:MAG: methionine--tRNA ligase [Candidatus Wolfebacteria bacterium]
MSENKFYITTAIDYMNAPPHIGHAFEKIQTDARARYQTLLGNDVYFLTGTDDHGIKIVRTAHDAGKEVREFATENANIFRELLDLLTISNNDFIRTSDREHHWPGALKLWNKLVESNDIYKSAYKGFYCVGCEAYITEKELVEEKCCIHDTKPEVIEEENYFFKLSKYAVELIEKIQSNELLIVPESRKNEVLRMLDEGLEDISFSRPKEKLNGWGIPVPGDESQLIYVWCDALSNYITGLGYGSDNTELFDTYWPADVHVIGKDIVRFHAIYWPAMLLSAGLPLPKTILVHGMIISGGKKMSKSLGNVIDPYKLINTYGAEALRYYLLREVSSLEDGDMTEEKFKETYNANLANGLGNLVSRILKMSSSYGVEIDHNELESTEHVMKDAQEYRNAFDSYKINDAADKVWEMIGALDQRIAEKEPYKLIKTDEDAAKNEVEYLLHELWRISILLSPFLPTTSIKIKSLIKENKTPDKPLFLRME